MIATMKKYAKIMMFKRPKFLTLRIFYNRHCSLLLNNVLVTSNSTVFGQSYQLNKYNSANIRAIIVKLSIIEFQDSHN